MLRTLPLLLVMSTSLNVLLHRLGSPDTRRVVAASPETHQPAPSRTTSSPAASPRATVTPTPTPNVTRGPSATPTPSATRRSYTGTGDLVVVPGTSPRRGHGPLRRYLVEVEAGLGVDGAAFAAAVDATLADPRGWAAGLSFERVASGPVAFRVTLASPRTTDRLCRPLDTGGIYSCWNGTRALLNAMRWHEGTAGYRGDLPSYRIYMVNHEVGHGLGHGHRMSCGPGGVAPVMMQQTKSLYGCRRNPWPLASER
jgi:hypothetical protein